MNVVGAFKRMFGLMTIITRLVGFNSMFSMLYSNIMKNFFLAFVGVMLALASFAQNDIVTISSPVNGGAFNWGNMSQSSMGLEVFLGPNLSNRYYENGKGFSDASFGLDAGFRTMVSLPDMNSLYISMGGQLSIQRSASASYEFSSGYFKVPLHMGGKTTLNKDYSFFFDAGPYIAYQVFGTTVPSAEYSRYASRYDVRYRYELDEPADCFAGVGFRLGVELQQKICVSLSSDYRMLRIYNPLKMQYSPESSVFGLNIGYKL